MTYRDTCLQARMRRALRTAPALRRNLQAGRAILSYGPWRHLARAIIRRNRPPKGGAAQGNLVPLLLDVPRLVQALRVDGVAGAGHMPPDMLNRLRAAVDALPPGEYGDFHVLPDVRALVECGDVLRVLRHYLGAEPELLECNLVIAHGEDPASRTVDAQRLFHFDYAGWHSLNLFIYLTDVEADSGAHQVVAGTHNTRRLWDAVRPYVPESEIMTRYTDRVRTITGRAGTMFFEDTAAFHRRQILRRRRVLLNILYASHRSWLSKGRLIPKYADYLHRTDSNPGG